MKNIFITGASGCIGHYLFDVLSKNPDYNLYLLIRNLKKVKFEYSNLPNVKIINDDMCNIENHADILKQMDYVILLTADWGGVLGNYSQTLSLLNMLDPQRCEKIIYFSTASILGADNKPIKEAGLYGTPYIKGKYELYNKLPKLKIYNKIIALFPTWVLGGDKNHPFSHAANAIIRIKKWLWFFKFFTFDASFHFIHAQDIALICDYLLRSNTSTREFVLGNAPITANEVIKEICEFYVNKIYFQIRINTQFVKKTAKLFGKTLSPWDIYCLDHTDMEYKTVNAETFALKSPYKTILDFLKEIDTN